MDAAGIVSYLPSYVFYTSSSRPSRRGFDKETRLPITFYPSLSLSSRYTKPRETFSKAMTGGFIFIHRDRSKIVVLDGFVVVLDVQVSIERDWGMAFLNPNESTKQRCQ